MLYCLVRQVYVCLNGALIGALILSHLCLHGIVIFRQDVKEEIFCMSNDMLLLINELVLDNYLVIFHYHLVTVVILFSCPNTIPE